MQPNVRSIRSLIEKCLLLVPATPGPIPPGHTHTPISVHIADLQMYIRGGASELIASILMGILVSSKESPDVQLKILNLLEQMVSAVSIRLLSILGQSKWTETLYQLAVSTEHHQVSIRIMRLAILWSKKSTGMRELCQRLEEVKTSQESFHRLVYEMAQLSLGSQTSRRVPAPPRKQPISKSTAPNSISASYPTTATANSQPSASAMLLYERLASRQPEHSSSPVLPEIATRRDPEPRRFPQTTHFPPMDHPDDAFASPTSFTTPVFFESPVSNSNASDENDDDLSNDTPKFDFILQQYKADKDALEFELMTSEPPYDTTICQQHFDHLQALASSLSLRAHSAARESAMMMIEELANVLNGCEIAHRIFMETEAYYGKDHSEDPLNQSTSSSFPPIPEQVWATGEEAASLGRLQLRLRDSEMRNHRLRRDLGKFKRLCRRQRQKYKTLRAKLLILSGSLDHDDQLIASQSFVSSKEVVHATLEGLNTLAMEMEKVRSENDGLRIEVDRYVAMMKLGTQHLLKASSASSKSSYAHLEALYKREMRLRRDYFNQLQELKGNIRVFCRLRPLNMPQQSILSFPERGNEEYALVVELTDKDGMRTPFEFDRVFDSRTAQEDVFEEVKPLVATVVDGYNVCLFAYGQTGSGKTHTLLGPIGNDGRISDSPYGLASMIMNHLFSISLAESFVEAISISVSALELYNNRINDLLVSKEASAGTTYSVRINGPQESYVENLSSVDIPNLDTWKRLLARASSRRAQAETLSNPHSSRSHMILNIYIHSLNKQTKTETIGKFSLVDLAGSERLKKSGASQATLRETVSINQSLFALGDTLSALSEGQKHVPFRNSLLTTLLQDCLLGRAKVLMMACVSQAFEDYSETLNTLNFGIRARGISLGPLPRPTQ